MSPLQIHARGIAPRMIKDGAPALTLGRSTQNDLVIPDHSLSRHHAKVWAERGRAFIEDLGSRNWTLVNGERIIGPQSVTPSDEVQVGNVRIFIEEVSSSQVLIDRTTQVDFPMPTMIIQAEKLRGGFPLKTGDDRLTQALGFIQEITLQLIREGSTQQLLEHLVERLHAYLDSGRAVALLRDAAGELKPAVVRTRRGGTESIRLPHTLVESVLERREAILLNDPEAQSSLASKSLMQIGITTAIITPLEADGQVLGLLYFDATTRIAPFSEADLGLVTTLAHVATAKIRTVQLQADVQKKKDLEREMDLARSIQQGFLPAHPPQITGYEILGYNAPAWRVSGDLYGFWELEDGSLCGAVADVSGKGVGPGLLMATFQAYMDAWSDWSLLPAALAERLSKALARHTAANRYITAFLFHLDPETGRLRYTSAGHTPALLLGRGGPAVQLSTPGLPLAMLPGAVAYEQGETILQPGELLCIYTDGVTEAESPKGEEFGIQSLEDVLEGTIGRDLTGLRDALLGALSVHTQDLPPGDDRTFVLVHRQS